MSEPGAIDRSPHRATEPASSSGATAARRRDRRAFTFGTLADLLVLAVVAVALGLHAKAFVGFPKGYDAYGHVSKVHLVLATFPHVNWNDAWYMGVPSFQGSYPPLYHLLVALLVWVTGASIPRTIVMVAAACVIVQTYAVYGTVRAVVSSRLGGVVAGGLWLASPTLWAQIVRDGFYPRILALTFAGIAVFGAVLHARRPSRRRFAGTVLALGAALSSHLIVGVPAALVVGALLVAAPGLSRTRRVRRLVGFAVAVAGLVAFFYLPLVVAYRSQRTFTHANPMPLAELIAPVRRAALDSLAPALVPFSAVLGALALWRARRLTGTTKPSTKPSQYSWPLRVAAICGAASLAWLAYAEAPRIGFFRHHTIYGLQPKQGLIYMAWLLSVGVGVLLGAVLQDDWSVGREKRVLLAGAVPVVVLICLALAAPRLPRAVIDYDSAGTRALMRIMPADAIGHDYRVGAGVDAVTEWINADSVTPQVRGYQAQSILRLNWQDWLEKSLKVPGTPAPVRNFLLDWNAVRWLYAGPGEKAAPYSADPADYHPLAAANKGRRIYRTYRFDGAGPILAATTAPTALVIGDDSHYDLVLRGLAPADANSALIIPIRGGAFVDDFSLAELERFDEVMLYGADAHDDRRAAALLSTYVQRGGGLVVEAGARSPLVQELTRLTGGPIPVAGSAPVRVTGGWAFRSLPAPVTDGIDFSAFGPPRARGNSSWLTAGATAVRPWAQPVLWSAGRPVVVVGRDGAGQVVWSGLNLPEHVNDHGNAAESEFLARMISSVARARAMVPPQGVASYGNPESRAIEVRSGTGVLLKENATADWSASIDGRRARIYRAGPDMMFVPLPATPEPITVAFRYRLSPLERAGFGLTFFSVAALLLFAAGARLPTRLRSRRQRGDPTR